MSCAVRAARARELADREPAVADLLRFYAALVEYQQRLVAPRNGGADEAASAYVVSGLSRTSGSLLHAIQPEWVGRAARDFILWLVRLKPDATYAAMQDVPEEEWRQLFESYRASPEDEAARFSEAAVFALEAVVQPIAEHLVFVRGVRLPPSHEASADRRSLGGGGQPDRGSGGRTGPRCPVCDGAPVVGVLREEGHGARRRLVCGLCFTEWDYLRVVCVKCGEQRFEALPVFSAEQFPHARVDACDTCRSYLKTIDATKDGRVVPVVDDLATIALDLWAQEQGYTRIRSNLMRI